MIPDGWQHICAEAQVCRGTFGPVWRPSMSASPTKWSDKFEMAIRENGNGCVTIKDPEGAGVTVEDPRTLGMMISCIRSWRSVNSRKGGVVNIAPGIEFVISDGRPFFRVLGSAYRTMDYEEEQRIMDKLRWTACPCCERKISRIRLLETYERRAIRYDPPEGGDECDW